MSPTAERVPDFKAVEIGRKEFVEYDLWYKVPAVELQRRGDELANQADILISYGQATGDEILVHEGLRRGDAARRHYFDYLFQFTAKCLSREARSRLAGQKIEPQDALEVWGKACTSAGQAIRAEHTLGWRSTGTVADGRRSEAGHLAAVQLQTILYEIEDARPNFELPPEVRETTLGLARDYFDTSGEERDWLSRQAEDTIADYERRTAQLRLA